MNILMLGWELPPHNSGGLGVACLHLTRSLARLGAAIDFVLPYSGNHPDTDFMRLHHTSSDVSKEIIGVYDSHKIDLKNKDYINFVRHYASEHPPDVIHAHDWLTMKAGLAAKEVSGSPLVVHVHATEFDRSGEHFGNPIVHEIEEQSLLMADKIIAVSQITKDIITREYGIPEDKVEVVHNALDVASLRDYEYNSRTYRYLENLKAHGYTVVATVTRLTVQKGLTYFLEAAAKASHHYDKLVYLIAGDGEQRDELIQKSAELDIADKVFFTGFVRGQAWRDAYSVADIFVMSSVSEPFGLTALEAAHHGNVLIISRQSGVGEVLENTMRYDFWDTDKLADELINIAASKSMASELKNNVKSEYAKITWDDVATKCLRIYNEAMA